MTTLSPSSRDRGRKFGDRDFDEMMRSWEGRQALREALLRELQMPPPPPPPKLWVMVDNRKWERDWSKLYYPTPNPWPPWLNFWEGAYSLEWAEELSEEAWLSGVKDRLGLVTGTKGPQIREPASHPAWEELMVKYVDSRR